MNNKCFKCPEQRYLVQKKFVIWSDNCAGQNKNHMMILLWIFLVRKQIYLITDKFLCLGHSFTSCDLDVVVIEQRKRKTKAFVPTDLHKLVENAQMNNVINYISFEVIPMSEKVFFDIHSACK